MTRPFVQSCENNKKAILKHLKTICLTSKNILEIGSGTGQHAVYFAANLPHLTWQTSDLIDKHEGINAWLTHAKLGNLLAPIALDLNKAWSVTPFDCIFTANTLHIVNWTLVENLFIAAAETLVSQGKFCIYGPFNYAGEFTSQSNAEFDAWLKNRDAASGIRDIEQIQAIALKQGLLLQNDITMPSNNRLLVFVKTI